MCPGHRLTWKPSKKSLLGCLEGKGEGRRVPKTMPAVEIAGEEASPNA